MTDPFKLARKLLAEADAKIAEQDAEIQEHVRANTALRDEMEHLRETAFVEKCLELENTNKALRERVAESHDALLCASAFLDTPIARRKITGADADEARELIRNALEALKAKPEGE